MTRVHRMLLIELLRNGALTLSVILAIYFLVALALVIGSSRAVGAPFEVLLRLTAFEAIATLWLTLPLASMTAALFTYGRARAERETTAMTMAGMSPRQILMPAITFGAVGMLVLSSLQAGVMPAAKFSSRLQMDEGVAAHLETFLKRSSRSIVEERWSVAWDEVLDDSGVLILRGLHLLVLDDARAVRQSIEAEFARPRLSEREGRLTLDLTNAVVRPRGQAPLTAERLEWPLELEGLGRDLRAKKPSYFSTEELLTERDRARSRLDAVVRSGSSAEEERQRRKEWFKLQMEFQARIAHAVSVFVFAFVGAIIGYRYGTKNRAIVFLLGFLIVAGVHYPLTTTGESLVEAGVLPAWLGRWLGNLALLGLSTIPYRRLLRA